MLWEITTFTKRCFSMHLHRLPACGSHATSVWKPSYQRVVAMLPTTGSSTTSSVVRLRVRANALPNDAVRTLLLVNKSARSSVCLRHLPCCGIAYCPLRPVTGMITSSICFLSCIAYPPLSTSFWRGIGVSRLCSCVLVKPSCQGFILLHLRL